MRKIVIPMCLCAALCGVGTIGANAATKCVALNTSKTLCRAYDVQPNLCDWAALCETGSVTVDVTGISMCSSLAGSPGNTAEDFTVLISENPEESVNCWCKALKPAVSKWVYITDLPSASQCAEQCGMYCGEEFQSILPTVISTFGYSNLDN